MDESGLEEKKEEVVVSSDVARKVPKNGKNKKKRIIITVIVTVVLIFIVGVFLLVGFNKKKDLKSIKNEAKEVYSKYRMSGNKLEDFDLRFLQLETNNQNVVYSPLSIKYALGMLSEGTVGDSKAQIDALIGDYKVNKYTNSKNMSFANAMFIKNTFKDGIKENYTTALQNKFNAEVIYDEFANPNNINFWVSDKTFGLINQLVEDVAEKQFYLINALAIDMEWNKLIQATTDTYRDQYSVSYAHEEYFDGISVIEDDRYGTVTFNKDSINSKAVEIGASINNYDIVKILGEDNIRENITKRYSEWLTKGECGGEGEPVDTFVNKYIEELDSNYKRVDASTDFGLYVDDNVKVFSKDLKEYNGTTLEYIGIMPKDITLNEYIKSSTAASLNNTISKIKTVESDNFEKGKITKITGGIPLFKYEYELDLMNDLKELGVKDIFSKEKANLSGIVKDPSIIIDDVGHKANIEFSNEGIKAAAATRAGGAGSTSCGFEYLYEVPVVLIDLNFDNPYLYIIRDKKSGEVWFVGTVYQPIENKDSNTLIINKGN